MYCVQERICCGVCDKSVIPNIYQKPSKSQGHGNNILKNQCTNSLIIKTHYKKS